MPSRRAILRNVKLDEKGRLIKDKKAAPSEEAVPEELPSAPEPKLVARVPEKTKEKKKPVEEKKAPAVQEEPKKSSSQDKTRKSKKS